MILLDANILIRMSDRNDKDYQRTLRAVFEARKTDSLIIVPQSLYEYWAVATRDIAYNGLGMTRDRARRWIISLQRTFSLLSEPPELLATWMELVAKYDVKGFRAHDARHVALMQLLKIEKLMTYNIKHFQMYPITIVEPGPN